MQVMRKDGPNGGKQKKMGREKDYGKTKAWKELYPEKDSKLHGWSVGTIDMAFFSFFGPCNVHSVFDNVLELVWVMLVFWKFGLTQGLVL